MRLLTINGPSRRRTDECRRVLTPISDRIRERSWKFRQKVRASLTLVQAVTNDPRVRPSGTSAANDQF
jgi:hypothetical protein